MSYCTPQPTSASGIFRCPVCGRQNPHRIKNPFYAECGAHKPSKSPPLAKQAWNLVTSLADFVADGCTTVSEEQYRERLEICDACDERRNNRCGKCGCRLSLKARGRAFKCPESKWPARVN